MPHNIELFSKGDEVYGRVMFEGQLRGRGMVISGKVESEDDALTICQTIRDALAPDVITRHLREA
jgi:hypothetical protein